MSLDYDLSIATDLKPIQALHIVSKGFDLEWDSASSNPCLFGSGILVGAHPQLDIRQSVIEEAFGFRPTIDVWFQINSNVNYEGGKHTLLWVTIELLRQISGDAVLLFNGESIIFQRLAGQLLLNEDWHDWATSHLSEVTLPFEVQNLPSPLL
ncbi:SitI3 family protein [Coleofasciculus sp. H7-2]|uniref:SitI3 family protein n=1 Tax=Coleofasciculus sp. H7-2 TaxID=3351545 RepID=UPI00366B9DE0